MEAPSPSAPAASVYSSLSFLPARRVSQSLRSCVADTTVFLQQVLHSRGYTLSIDNNCWLILDDGASTPTIHTRSTIVKIRRLIPLLLALLCGQVFAADGSITITFPANGAMSSTKHKVPVIYEAMPGANGDHLHLYVDGNRVDILHQAKGAAEPDPLSAGKHRICLTVNAKTHVPTGAQKDV